MQIQHFQPNDTYSTPLGTPLIPNTQLQAAHLNLQNNASILTPPTFQVKIFTILISRITMFLSSLSYFFKVNFSGPNIEHEQFSEWNGNQWNAFDEVFFFILIKLLNNQNSSEKTSFSSTMNLICFNERTCNKFI